MESIGKMKIVPVSKERLGNIGSVLSNMKITKDDFDKIPQMPQTKLERLRAVAVALASSSMWYNFNSRENTHFSVFKSKVGGIYIDNSDDIENEVWKFSVTSDDIDNGIHILEKNGYVIGFNRTDDFCCLMPVVANTEDMYERFCLYDYDDIAYGMSELMKYIKFGVYVRRDYVPAEYYDRCELTSDISPDRKFGYPLMDMHGNTVFYARLCWEDSDYGGHWYILMNKREHLDWVKVDIKDFQKKIHRSV